MLCVEKLEKTCSRKKGKTEELQTHGLHFWRVAVQKKSEEKKIFLNVTDKMKGEWFDIVMDSVMQWVHWMILE